MKTIHILFISVIFVITLSLPTLAQTIDLTEACTPETSKQYDNFIMKNAPSENAFVAVQRIAEPYIRNRKWEKAVNIFKTCRPLFKEMYERFTKIISLLEAKEEGLVVKNLGSGINTDKGEYSPVPSADGLLMYFTGRLRPDCIGSEDIFVSEWRDGKWQKAVNLGNSINSEDPEAILSISADGNRIILFGSYKESLGRGDIFYADKTVEGWGKIQHFPKPVNSEYFDCDASITSDGKAILFTSDRPGGEGSYHKKGELFHGDYWGNTDIYICLQTATGWSGPINLGPTINTPYCEYSPFLHPDGKTLYFSSAGHYGLGRLDVFMSRRLSQDSWTEWSEPVNLGKEINTAGNDCDYKIATSGTVAYFGSGGRNDGFGNVDIYSISLPKKERPEQVATIRGKVTDDTGNPMEVDIKWEDLSTGENMGQLKSDPKNGTYFIVLPLGRNYGYYADKEGYYPGSNNVDLRGKKESLNIIENIILGETTGKFNNIFFGFDSTDLKPESFLELNRFVRFLQQHPQKKVEIAGHTDDVGPGAYNLDLSKRRAESVVAYLVKNGLAISKLIAKGYGKRVPVDTSGTEEASAKNRRVEFKFVK